MRKKRGFTTEDAEDAEEREKKRKKEKKDGLKSSWGGPDNFVIRVPQTREVLVRSPRAADTVRRPPLVVSRPG